MGGKSKWNLAANVVEFRAIIEKCIDIWSRDFPVTVRAHVVRSQRVDGIRITGTREGVAPVAAWEIIAARQMKPATRAALRAAFIRIVTLHAGA